MPPRGFRFRIGLLRERGSDYPWCVRLNGAVCYTCYTKEEAISVQRQFETAHALLVPFLEKLISVFPDVEDFEFFFGELIQHSELYGELLKTLHRKAHVSSRRLKGSKPTS